MSRVTILSLLLLCALVGTLATQNKLCTANLHIAGVARIASHLWFVVQQAKEQSYLVYEFDSHSQYLVVNASTVRRIAPLHQVWPGLDASIHPSKKRIVSMAALDESAYERGELKAEGQQSHDALRGGILFVFDDQAQVYDLATGTVLHQKGPTRSSPVIDATSSEGALFTKGAAEWTYQAFAFKGSLVWPTSPVFGVGEIAQEKSVWDGQHERLLLLALGSPKKEIASVLANWTWLHGFLDSELGHLFTDQGVYLMERAESQLLYLSTIRPSHAEDELMPLKSLKLNYSDYFLCNTTTTAKQWSILYRALIFVKPQEQQGSSNVRSTVIYVLFGLHFIVALTMLVIIVVMKVNTASLKSQGRSSKEVTKMTTQVSGLTANVGSSNSKQSSPGSKTRVSTLSSASSSSSSN